MENGNLKLTKTRKNKFSLAIRGVQELVENNPKVFNYPDTIINGLKELLNGGSSKWESKAGGIIFQSILGNWKVTVYFTVKTRVTVELGQHSNYDGETPQYTNIKVYGNHDNMISYEYNKFIGKAEPNA